MTCPDGKGRPPAGIIFAKFNSEKSGLPICANISFRCGSKMPLRASELRLVLGSDTQGSYKRKSWRDWHTVDIKCGKIPPSHLKVPCHFFSMHSSEDHQCIGLPQQEKDHLAASLYLCTLISPPSPGWVLSIALERGLEHFSSFFSCCSLPLGISLPFYCSSWLYPQQLLKPHGDISVTFLCGMLTR